MGRTAAINVAGERFLIEGSREDITALLRRRRLGSDDGIRELRTTDGDWITVATGAVASVYDALTPTRKGKLGFA